MTTVFLKRGDHSIFKKIQSASSYSRLSENVKNTFFSSKQLLLTDKNIFGKILLK
jgi:hypothetical protein